MRETITAKDAAALLGKSEWWVYEQAKRRVLPHVRVGRTVLFRRASLLAWMEAQERASVAAEPEQGKIRRVK
jgi:excisionase family DNA binding protein